MSFHDTTCTSSVFPVFALYAAANCVQNADVFSFEYSAATNLIVVAFVPSEESLEVAPVPPPQAARLRARPVNPAVTKRARLFILEFPCPRELQRGFVHDHGRFGEAHRLDGTTTIASPSLRSVWVPVLS